MIPGLFMVIIFLIIGFASGAFKRVPNQRRVKGVIESVEQRHQTPDDLVTYTGIISYMVNGQRYYTETSYQSSFFRTRKRVWVCFDEQNPGNSFVQPSIIIYAFMFMISLTGIAVFFNELSGFLN
jgi:phage shock protein PspC (stress-responsive transcriptional regulator)